MLNPAKPFSAKRSSDTTAAATVKADLTGLLDRARDERFRLLKMLKDARSEVAVTVEQAPPIQSANETEHSSTAEPAPEDQTETRAIDLDQARTLLGRLIELDNQLDAKMDRLNRVADDKLSLLKAMDARVSRRVAELDQAQAATDQRLANKLSAHRQKMADLTDAADAELQAQAQRLDAAVAGLTELFEHQADRLLDELQSRVAEVLNPRDKSDADRRAA